MAEGILKNCTECHKERNLAEQCTGKIKKGIYTMLLVGSTSWIYFYF